MQLCSNLLAVQRVGPVLCSRSAATCRPRRGREAQRNARKARRRACTTCLFGKGRRQPEVSIEATPLTPPQRQQSGAVLLLFAALALGLGLAYRSWRAGKQAPDFSEPVDTFQQNPQEGQEYKAALARTRQAVSVQKAIQLKNNGSPARAMVELERALQENSICREAIFSGLHDAKEIRELYQMHVRSTNVPPNYAKLLQLRDMLELPARDAAALEAEVLGSGASFSI